MKIFALLGLLGLFFNSCTKGVVAPKIDDGHISTPSKIPFSYAGKLLKIPVTINGTIRSHFIFDTGIGVNLISKSICDNRIDCTIAKSMSGKRMSGQELTIALTQQASLSIRGHQQQSVYLGVWDMSNGFLPDEPAFEEVDGFLSLNFFESTPVTIDYKDSVFVIENNESLKDRVLTGTSVPIKVDRDDEALVIFMKLQIPNGSPAWVEVDLGSNILILDNSYMERLNVRPGAEGVKKVSSSDETGNPFIRHFSKIRGSIFPENASKFSQSDMTVMFQDIIYDGLVGNDFMSRFTVTYDLKNSRLIFNK